MHINKKEKAKEWRLNQKMFVDANTNIYTHPPKPMHADDVGCVALLRVLYGIAPNQVKFIEEIPALKDIKPGSIFVDIGGSKSSELIAHGCYVFDHHGYTKYRDSYKRRGQYASLGLLWAFIAPEILSFKSVKFIDDALIGKLDAHDTGERNDTLATYIASLNPMYDTFETAHGQFWKAVLIMEDVIKRRMEECFIWENMYDEALEIVKENLDENGNKKEEFVVLKEYKPVTTHLGNIENAPSFVIFENKRGNWNVKRLKNSTIQFPVSWIGDDAELPEDAVIMTKGDTLLVMETKEAAIKAAKIAISIAKASITFEDSVYAEALVTN